MWLTGEIKTWFEIAMARWQKRPLTRALALVDKLNNSFRFHNNTDVLYWTHRERDLVQIDIVTGFLDTACSLVACKSTLSTHLRDVFTFTCSIGTHECDEGSGIVANYFAALQYWTQHCYYQKIRILYIES